MRIGDRIRQARVSAGMTLRDLAGRAAPLSATAISRYEQGEDVPRPDTLQRLALALEVPTGYFFREISIRLERPRYRKKSRFGLKAQQAVEGQITERLERYVEVESLFPPDRFPKPGVSPEDRRHIARLEDAEEVAEEFRQRWELGKDPIGNLAGTLEDRGVKVLLMDAPDGFDGLACWANGEIPVVVANASKSWDRQRFDLGHEFGELVLDSAPDVNSETAAHRFSGAFLVPAEVVRRELGSKRATLNLEELLLLKMKYGLSMQAWVRRAFDTGVISEGTYSNLFRIFSIQGFRKNEPGGDRSPDHAQRFELLVRQASSEGLMTQSFEEELLRHTLRATKHEGSG